MYQPEYAAVLYILGSPTLWQRAAPHVRDADFDWPALLDETRTMSGGEAVLVRAAHELWTSHKSVGLWELVRRLDSRAFARVVEALRISRGGEPAAQSPSGT